MRSQEASERGRTFRKLLRCSRLKMDAAEGRRSSGVRRSQTEPSLTEPSATRHPNDSLYSVPLGAGVTLDVTTQQINGCYMIHSLLAINQSPTGEPGTSGRFFRPSPRHHLGLPSNCVEACFQNNNNKHFVCLCVRNGERNLG